jgi:hypothetical protein
MGNVSIRGADKLPGNGHHHRRKAAARRYAATLIAWVDLFLAKANRQRGLDVREFNCGLNDPVRLEYGQRIFVVKVHESGVARIPDSVPHNYAVIFEQHSSNAVEETPMDSPSNWGLARVNCPSVRSLWFGHRPWMAVP